MSDKKVKTEPEKQKNRSEAFNLLYQAEWKVNFLRDVAFGRALNADEGHVGITPEGEQGLALILEEIGKSLNQAVEML